MNPTLRSALSPVLNALDRDAVLGRPIRGEMAAELRSALNEANSETEEAALLLARVQELLIHAQHAGYDDFFRNAMQNLDGDMLLWAKKHKRQQLGFQR